MNVKPDESVLVVSGTRKLKIAKAFAYAATALEAHTVIAIMEPVKQGGEPPRAVAEAMKSVDGILLQPTVWVDKRQLLKNGKLLF